jgi:long-chain fatty acid transport protein
MTTPHFRRTRLAGAVAGAVLALGAGQAFGAAFALQENSGSGLGNAYAGGAAAAEDAATVWTNPAGMARIGSNQVAAAVNLVNPSAKFNNNGGSLAAFNQPLGGSGGDAGSLAAVPNLYVVLPINKQFAFGLGLNAPFGLVTEYDDGWLGRYQALKSDVKTINVNPSISWRMTDNFSVGVGANYQQIKATFTNNVNYSGALATAAATAAAGGLIPAALVPTIVGATGGLDAKADVTGDDNAWGWNIGALWEINPNLRVGASYRSSIKYDVSGNVNFSYPTLPALPPALAPVVGLLASNVNNVLANGGVTSSIELPPIANVSFFSRLNDKWDIMADAQWTGWSTIQELKFVRTTGATLSNTPEGFKDTWRISVGTNYHMDDKWMFRGGVAWDQSPVNSTDMTPRLPDNDRTWLAFGVQYAASKALKLDAGFSYIWVKDPQINQNAGSTTANGLISGNYSANVTILSFQGTYSF